MKRVFVPMIVVALLAVSMGILPIFAATPAGVRTVQDGNSAIPANTFITLGTDGRALRAAGSTAWVVGVSETAGEPNQDMSYATFGMEGAVRFSGTVAAGDRLTVDGNGFAVTASADANIVQHIVAIAITSEADANKTVQANLISDVVGRGLTQPRNLASVEANVAPGVPFVLEVVTPAADANIVYAVPAGSLSLQVIDAHSYKLTASSDANDAVQLFSGHTANFPITGKVSLNVAAGTRVANAVLDANTAPVAAGGVLRVKTTAGEAAQADARVYITCIWKAPS